MQIRNGTVPFFIASEDRPYIEFERTLNKGTKKREEKKNAKGEVTRAAHPGQFTEIWRKHIINHRAPFDVYCWATPEWVLRKVALGCKPTGYGNIEKLPATYPSDWRAKVEACISAVAGQADARRELEEMKKQIAEANEATASISAAKGRTRSERSGDEESLRKAG